MLAHGVKHVRALRSGPGMANWLTSLGLSHGAIQAQMLTWSEVGVAPLLLLGLLTPAAYGVVASLMLVALVTNDRDKSFFITARPTEGREYVGPWPSSRSCSEHSDPASGHSIMSSTGRSRSSQSRRSLRGGDRHRRNGRLSVDVLATDARADG